MKAARLWCLFFMIWPVLALYFCWVAPYYGWSFPGENEGLSPSPMGQQIDNLFWIVMWIVTIVFIGTQVALGYILWTASQKTDDEKAVHIHGSHTLELIWTVIPGLILLFLAFYQLNVWAEFRVKSQFPKQATENVIAEVTARQFEWRIRYPALGESLQGRPQASDYFDVNEIHIPAGTPVMIRLRTEDVQHSLFIPMLRVKQDAVPGLVIPIWFEVNDSGKVQELPFMCAELCGWGHYKMAGKLIVHPKEEYAAFMKEYEKKRSSDGVSNVTPSSKTGESESGGKSK